MVARANGVGPKLASRIVNELKDKAGGLAGLFGGLGIAAEADMALPAGSASTDAISALQNLASNPPWPPALWPSRSRNWAKTPASTTWCAWL
jgi:Holliday junction DNA helicase RuvA